MIEGQNKTEIIHKFCDNILSNQKELEPEFVEFINDNFWDLLESDFPNEIKK